MNANASKSVSHLSRRQALKLTAATTSCLFAGGVSPSSSEAGETCRQPVPGTPIEYYLAAFDSDGQEREWNGSGLCSQAAIRQLTSQPITDVFIFSHGWMGDVPQAKIQYENWITAMTKCPGDISRLKQQPTGFSPLLIGVHWPSLPFGDEELRAGIRSTSFEQLVDVANGKFANTRRSRNALGTILQAKNDQGRNELSPELQDAFKVLWRESISGSLAVSDTSGLRGAQFDPQQSFQAIQADSGHRYRAAAVGAADDWTYNLRYLLATVSFWTMKNRAKIVGETGVHRLIKSLQAAVPAGRTVRFHLMGHSFGCIVMSSSLLGARGPATSLRPVNSLSLIQGALSHWSFASNAYNTNIPGSFHQILTRSLVDGPIISTQSMHDYAVGSLYPYAAGVAGQVAMALPNGPQFPKYGAVGAFGIQGDNCNPQEIDVKGVDGSYNFKRASVYNINCDRVIRKLSPISGAHSDISHPEVAHAVWEAAAVSINGRSPLPLPPQPPSPQPTKPDGLLRRILRRR